MRNQWLVAAALVAVVPASAQAACCYFSAKNMDILQPAQKVFITWDPEEKIETFTVQPKFEGNALDFGMVIPTPSQPKLNEMPRDFFKHLAVYSIMKNREKPVSKLLPRNEVFFGAKAAGKGGFAKKKDGGDDKAADKKEAVIVLETGVVGSLDYKILEASRADALYEWLKTNKYSFAGDEATLNYYIQKKWLFTVMKIDTMQMKRNKDGTFAGEVTPTRFQFASEKLVYPLKITQISVREKTEALFYVQAPYKVDLPGDMTYQYMWIPLLQSSQKPGSKGGKGVKGGAGLPGRGSEWLEAFKGEIPPLLTRAREIGFVFVRNQRPTPNAKGHIATTMEWARKLSKEDIAILNGKTPYSETLPNVDEGFTKADVNDPARAEAVYKVIRARLAKSQQERPNGYLVRHAPAEDVKDLQKLAGHLTEGLFITKFRKIFARDEMNDDLSIVPARYNGIEDVSEYEEILPTSPP